MSITRRKHTAWQNALGILSTAVFVALAVVLTFVSCSSEQPTFFRFIDKLESAKIEGPLLNLATSELKDGNTEQLRSLAGQYLNRDLGFSDRTDPYVKKMKIAGSIRTALFAPAPSRFIFSVRIPSKPFLGFGYAFTPDAWETENSATTFKIWLVKDEKKHILFSDSIEPGNDESARRWFDEELELSAYEGEHVELVFETVQSAEGVAAGYAVWSNPTLYSAAGRREKPNVILISIDTLRADHLGCYGYHRQTSPNIDRLAQNGILFKNAFSQSSWTIPSHGSIFTSKLPHTHGATIDTGPPANTWYPLPFSNLTLAEVLRENGYVTAAFTSGGSMISRTGLHQGFDLYYNNSGPEWDPLLNIERLVSKTSDWLERNRHTPFFLFFHTFEVHTPYVRNYFTDGLERGRLSDTIEFSRDIEYLKEATDAEKEYTIALYDGGIYHADHYIGMILKVLSRSGLSHNTIIVLTSDHGEEFWDHYPLRTVNHAHSAYDELLHIPLIFVLPHEDVKGRVIEDQIRSTDVFTTILSALSIKYDKEDIDGENLLSLIRGNAMDELVAYSEEAMCGPERKSIRTRQYKYVYSPDLTLKRGGYAGVDFYRRGTTLLTPVHEEELYDLENDPGEKTNIADIQPHLTGKFRKKIRQVFGIPTARFLNRPSGNLFIRLEGTARTVETVTVQTMDGSILSSSDGGLSIYRSEGVIDLWFDSPGSEGRHTYLINITYDDKTTERMSVTGSEHSEFTEGTSTPKKETDKELIKQLKQVGYMYIDPNTTGLIFSSFAYLLGILVVLLGSAVLPLRWLFRYFNNRLGDKRGTMALLLSGAVVLTVLGSVVTCILLFLFR